MEDADGMSLLSILFLSGYGQGRLKTESLSCLREDFRQREALGFCDFTSFSSEEQHFCLLRVEVE
jgi:hypothetical protein